MSKIKVFVTMFNRLQKPKKFIEYLADTGCEPILIDNNSTYPPLLEWYDDCPFKVHRFKINYRERVFWDSKLFNEYKDKYYVVTDHDLSIEGIPNDYIEVLINGLDLNPNVTKCGLSLKIDDLSDNEYTNHVKRFEGVYWHDKDNVGNYIAGVDTTFAVYDRDRQNPGWDHGNKFFFATRTPPPYTAKHLPWYLTKEDVLKDEDEKYYHIHCNNQWSRILKKEFNINL